MNDPRPAALRGTAFRKVPGLQDTRADRSARRPPGAPPLTRRYEAAVVLPDGSSREFSRLGPAIPAFEQAFAAFARGAPVLTPRGPVPIEDLAAGDPVLDDDGAVMPAVWIGRITLLPGPAGNGWGPLRVAAESFGAGRPADDIVLGPAARLLRHGAGGLRLQPLADLVDGCNVVALRPAVPVTVYHLCLPRHAVLRVGGLPIEALHPGLIADTLPPEQAAMFLALFPHLTRAARNAPPYCPQDPFGAAA